MTVEVPQNEEFLKAVATEREKESILHSAKEERVGRAQVFMKQKGEKFFREVLTLT